jgi:two-component sensor histidine kinase
VSDTPISDSTPHNVGDLAMVCRRLERKLAATRKYLSEVSERIKRLEEAGDALCENSNLSRWDSPADAARKLTEQSNWRKAKEAKP